MMRHIRWMTLSFTNACLISTVYAANPPKMITIYGLQAGSHLSDHHHNIHYNLQIASFTNRHNAEQLRNQLAKLTTTPVHVVSSQKLKNVYQVVIGPFAQASTLKQVSQQLLSKNIDNDQITTHPAKPVETSTADNTLSMHHATTQPLSAKPYTPSTQMKGEWKDMEQRSTFKAGPYVGASIGLQNNISGAPAAATELGGNLSAGWGYLWGQRFYLAGEVFGGDNGALKNYRSTSTHNSLQSGWYFGGDILPGLMITDHVLAYARAGAVNTRFNEINANRTAWQVGLGGQTTISKNLDIRAEYIYSLYSSIPGISRPQTSQVNAGIVQKFE